MKMKNVIISTFVAAFMATGSVNAATTDLGLVSPGQSGGFLDFSNPSTGFLSSVVTGLLPSDSQITFTYNFSGFSGVLSDQGNYSYSDPTTTYAGSTFSSSTGANSSTGSTSPVGSSTVTASNALVLSSANINGNTGTAVITNLSAGVANFASLLIGFLSGRGTAITYTVANVPLPASAYLFGMGLLALAGMGYFRKKQQVIALA